MNHFITITMRDECWDVEFIHSRGTHIVCVRRLVSRIRRSGSSLGKRPGVILEDFMGDLMEVSSDVLWRSRAGASANGQQPAGSRARDVTTQSNSTVRPPTCVTSNSRTQITATT